MGLLGRDSELATCHAAVRDGRGPVGLVICGEPGIGKTALHRAVVDAAADSGWRVLSTVGLPGQVDLPLANLADLLDPSALEVLDQLPAVQADALRAALRLAPIFTPLDEPLIARATVNVLRALAGTGLVVAVDDEQWLDADTRRLLGMAAVWLTAIPVVWLVTVRADHAEEGLGAVLAHEFGARLTKVSLSALAPDLLGRLIRDRIPGRWSSRLLHRIVALSAGNPYAALELARETAATVGCDSAEAQLPRTMIASLQARLERLSPATMAVVQVAAVTTRPTRHLMRVVVGAHANSAVDDAIEADVLDSTPPDPVLRFTHPLLREVTVSAMSRPSRRRLHRRIAALVEDQDEAATHLAAGADEPDEAIAATVAAAAERAWKRGAFAAAAALIEAAVTLTPDPDGETAWEWRMAQLDCLAFSNEVERARLQAEKWTPIAPEAVRVELTVRRGFLAPDAAAGWDFLAQALSELGHDPAAAAQVAIALALRAAGNTKRFAEGRAFAEAAVRNARHANDPVLLRTALGAAGDLAGRAGEPDAGVLLREAVALPGWDDTGDHYGSPERNLGFWHSRRGESGPARDLLRKVLEASARRGQDRNVAAVRGNLVWVEWAAGQWDEAAHHAIALAQYEQDWGCTQAGAAAAALSLVAAGRGEVDEARAIATRGLSHAEDEGQLGFAGECRFVLGLLELSIDEPAAAVAWLETGARLDRDSGFVEPAVSSARPDLIEGYARVGRIDEAADLLRELQDVTARLDHPWGHITCGRAAAIVQLAIGDPTAAIDAVTPAVAGARALGAPFELGRCLLTLGTAQRRGRHRRDAARTLDKAIAVFDQLGAVCWTRLARAQRARLAHSSDDILTPTEQRVAELVAQGLTNTAIAATLLISVKTVEANLTRIYRKLGVRGRVDLARRHTT